MDPCVNNYFSFSQEAVERQLGHKITPEQFTKAESFARRKIARVKEANPEATYYDDWYLVLLTADTVREMDFSDYTLLLSMARMSQDYTQENKKDLKGATK